MYFFLPPFWHTSLREISSNTERLKSGCNFRRVQATCFSPTSRNHTC
nr:MAG TPA: hypothetical protein [Caudoviricetes sp.]